MIQKRFDRAETVELLSIPRDEEPLGPDSSSEAGKDISDRKAVESTRKHNKKRKTENWKRSLYLGSLASVIVLLFNVSFVAWAVSHHDLTENRGVLYTGDCTKTKRMSTGLHLVINILSTALLCASSYTMVERCCFYLQACYNSTIFSTITNVEYEIFAGNKPFSDFNANTVRPPHDDIETDTVRYMNPYFSFARMLEKGQHGELYPLKNADCMSAYATNFQNEYGSVLLLTDDFHPNDTDFDFLSYQGASTPMRGNNPYAWMCCNHSVYACDMQTLCRDQLPAIRAHVDNWIVGGYRVKSCLVERIPGKCKLEYSLPLAIIVIVFNVVKAIIICAVALTMTELPLLTTGDAIWSGLGITNTDTLISGNAWPPSLITNTIIANTPQVVFSMLYFVSNSVLTAMTLAAEWSNYALHRKGLRVSSTPQGSQRTTYFLSLPYTYAIPLLVFSTVLHWLISQSLFLVNVETYNMQLERFRSFDFATCGYSPVAIVSAIVVGGVMLLGLVGLGFRRFASGMPVAGSCSRAIAAACYPGSSVEGDGMETMPLQWGVVYEGAADGVEVGRCAFSGGEVGMPSDGVVYM
ncbi:hypothetical protein APSETT444_007383 [Aspergillus pseudonomiae]